MLTERAAFIATYFAERFRQGLPEVVGATDREVVFIVDGVGGFQAAPLMVRRALREEGYDLGTIFFDWQFGLWGEIWTDLMWLRRNRLMGAKLARKIATFCREHPKTRVHLFAVSAGTGVAVFALETLPRRELIDTVVLACPALSPTYNLAAALRPVRRCYALISARDRVVLGLGTRLFGTVDRSFARAAGLVGFQRPEGLSAADADAYEKMGAIHWSPQLRAVGHYGGHTGWVNIAFLRHHLLPMLRGDPLLPVRAGIAD